MKSPFRGLWFPSLAAVVAAAGSVHGGSPPALTELSLTGRWGYDDNVFATETERLGYPLANRGDQFWQWSLRGAGKLPEVMALGTATQVSYTATQTRYDRFNSTESHLLQRVQVTSTKTIGFWRGTFEANVAYIDGSRQTPRYLIYSAYGMAVPRERREQWQTALKAESRCSGKTAFVRLNGAFTLFDLMSEHHQPTGDYLGWMNYVDRSDAWVGLGAGWKPQQTTWTLDWRRGGQYQQALPWAPASGSNDYQRVLFGAEREFSRTLKVSACAGPDWRRYADRASSTEAREVTPYGELTLDWKTSPLAQLSLTGKRWRWVASSGKTTYNDSSAALSLKSAWSAQWTTQVGLQWMESDYVPPALRRDTLTTWTAGVTWQITKAFSATLDVAASHSQNHLPIASAQGREYARRVCTLGFKWSR